MSNYYVRNVKLKALHFTEKIPGFASKLFGHKKVVFLHIPKCGGTSISSAIAGALCAGYTGFVEPVSTRHLSSQLLNGAQAEGSELLMNMRRSLFFDYYQKDKRYIYGHFPVVKQCLLNPRGYIFITILREPISRFISQFQYFLTTRIFPNNKDINLNDIEALWKDYYVSDLAKFHGNIISSYLDDSSSLCYGTLDSVSRAKENLTYFSIVGFLEDLNNFCGQFQVLVGQKIQIQSVKNRTSDRLDGSKQELLIEFFTQDKYEQIHNLCSSDIELYEWAKKLKSLTS